MPRLRMRRMILSRSGCSSGSPPLSVTMPVPSAASWSTRRSTSARRNRRRMVVVLVAVGAGQIAAANRNEVRGRGAAGNLNAVISIRASRKRLCMRRTGRLTEMLFMRRLRASPRGARHRFPYYARGSDGVPSALKKPPPGRKLMFVEADLQVRLYGDGGLPGYPRGSRAGRHPTAQACAVATPGLKARLYEYRTRGGRARPTAHMEIDLRVAGIGDRPTPDP